MASTSAVDGPSAVSPVTFRSELDHSQMLGVWSTGRRGITNIEKKYFVLRHHTESPALPPSVVPKHQNRHDRVSGHIEA